MRLKRIAQRHFHFVAPTIGAHDFIDTDAGRVIRTTAPVVHLRERSYQPEMVAALHASAREQGAVPVLTLVRRRPELPTCLGVFGECIAS